MHARRFALFLPILAVLAGWLCACARTPVAPGTPASASPQVPDLQQQAAAEATAIIQRAEATAMVLQAQAQATALVQKAQAPEPTPSLPALLSSPTPTSGVTSAEDRNTPTAAPEGEEAPETEDDAAAVQLLSVGFGAEGALIVVNYRASPAAAGKFWPGVLSVTDEATGTVFNEVPVMPVIGPLIARPREQGQLGYVMLVHAPAILHSGSLVTVVLDTFKQEHVPVQ